MYNHLCASLSIIPLSHMRKCRQDSIHSKLGSMNMMVLFTSCSCLQRGWLRHRISTEPLMYNLQIFEHLTLILRRSRTGTVWFYTSTSNKRAARPKLYTKALTMDLKLMYSRLTLMRISINLQEPCVLYIGTGVSLLFRERFLYEVC